MNFSIYKKAGLFYCLSTIIPWMLWFLAGYISHRDTLGMQYLPSVIAFAGLVMPVLVMMFLINGNKELQKDIAHRIFNFREVKSTYVVLTFVLMPVSILLAQAVSLLFGFSIVQFRLAESFSFSSGVFPVWFMLIMAPLLEELAWHTYGTDALRSRFNLFTTSMLFAFYWGIWHFPLSGIKDYYHSNLVEEGWIYSLNFILSLFPFVVIMNWIYYKTNRNILLPIIFHISAGYFNEIFATHPMSKVIQTGLLLLFSLFLIINDKKFFFSKEMKIVTGKEKTIKGKNRLDFNTKFFVIVIFMLVFSVNLSSQTITQTIRGKVFDEVTGQPVPFASIVIEETNPLLGTVSDADGQFKLENVKVGRYTIGVSMLGYSSYEVKEYLVSSGQIDDLNIGLRPCASEIDEVVVRVNKSNPINSMATLSSRQFTIEETQRYAGGLEDPARLVSTFAGVSAPSVNSNGISVRGNNPDGVLWCVEGVEVPNPNHFANLTIAGGGLLTAISSYMMGNSDFYTGAFPAEFGNASSGVFDIKLREGNRLKNTYALEAGVLGIGAMAQGPVNKKTGATYIVNYRNSTMAAIAPLLPDDAGVLKYQDLNYKINLPTKNCGTFTLWGLGAIDGVDTEAADSSDWETNEDRDNSETSMYMFASSVSHKLSMKNDAFLRTSFSVTGSGLTFVENRLDYNLQPNPQSEAENSSNRISIQSDIKKRFSPNHSNKTGLRYSHLFFDLDVMQSLNEGELPTQLVRQNGNAGFLEAYSQSKINLNSKLVLNAGINAHYFLLNHNFSLEPRIGLKYNFSKNQNISLAYGIHSRLEQLSVYFISIDGDMPNKNLDFMKSSHYVLSYQANLFENIHLSIEPYYQHLKGVPVSPTSYISTLNNNNALFFNEALVNEGTGENKGVDVTLEKYMSKGYYYMLTASVFDAKYTAADGVERNTRFNRNYVFNFMFGKEWIIRNNNILSANVRLNYLGGNRIEAIDIEASTQQHDVVYGETEGNLSFSNKFDDMPIGSLTLSYRINKPKHTSVWSLQVLNFNSAEEFSGDYYNLKTNQVEARFEGLSIPNVSYKIEF